jgi:hypothetical protein
LPGLVPLVVSTVALAGGGWEDSASLGVTVDGHAFHDVKVVAGGCKLASTLRFEAPAKGYEDPRNPVRNYHLFQARVRFASGRSVDSKVFGNAGPGERIYTFESDTAAAGCWAKEPNKVVKLDVIGCRGHSCDLGAFD